MILLVCKCGEGSQNLENLLFREGDEKISTVVVPVIPVEYICSNCGKKYMVSIYEMQN